MRPTLKRSALNMKKKSQKSEALNSCWVALALMAILLLMSQVLPCLQEQGLNH